MKKTFMFMLMAVSLTAQTNLVQFHWKDESVYFSCELKTLWVPIWTNSSTSKYQVVHEVEIIKSNYFALVVHGAITKRIDLESTNVISESLAQRDVTNVFILEGYTNKINMDEMNIDGLEWQRFIRTNNFKLD